MEKAVGECVDFALVNRAHPEHLRTAWIHSLMQCSFNRPILQAGAPRPRVHGNQMGARPPILGTGLSLLQSSVIQNLSPSGPPVLPSKEPWKKRCYGGLEERVQGQLFSLLPLTCQSIQRVGQMLAVTSLGCSSWEQLANCMLIRVHTQLLLPMLGEYMLGDVL